MLTVEDQVVCNGDELSVLSYNTLVDYDLDGDGFLSFDGFEDNVDLGPNLLDGTNDHPVSSITIMIDLL